MNSTTFRPRPLLLALLALSLPLHAGGGTNGTTTRISLTSGGAQVFQASDRPSISFDGQRIAFDTAAALVPEDTNGFTDVYVFDRAAGTVTLASRGSFGTLGNDASFEPAISGDGRFVAFSTHATNWVGFDTNGQSDVMLKDLLTGQLRRVSTPIGSLFAASGSSRRSAISFDGRFVAFDTTSDDFSGVDTNGASDVYVRDFLLDTISLVSQGIVGGVGNGTSARASLSSDGRFVAFESQATNLVFGDSNGKSDVFVRDMQDLVPMELVSRLPSGVLGNGHSSGASLSGDARFVAFASESTNYVFGDVNGSKDVFVLDRLLDNLRLVSSAPGGQFPGVGDSFEPRISSDGRFVAYSSSAPGLTAPQPIHLSCFVRELKSYSSYLVSRPTGPTGLPDNSSYAAVISGDGKVVAFRSAATNLVPGDVNLMSDVFVRELYADPRAYCNATVTSGGCEPQLSFTGLPRASQNGGFVITCSEAPNQKSGLFFYGLSGRQSAPFGNGELCVKPPVARTGVLSTGGNLPPASDCSGLAQIDMNSYAAGFGGIAPLPELSELGQVVNVQFWGRDPQAVGSTTFLSEALEYVVGP